MTQLKAGQMGSASDPTTVPCEFKDSMAAAIEVALSKVLVGEGFPPISLGTNSSDDRDRRLIFVAIAQGVVEYLCAKDEAFRVRTTITGHRIEIEQEDPL